MSFGLWDTHAAGAQRGVTQQMEAVAVVNGLFTVLLNDAEEFGPTAFNGEARFVEVVVHCPGDVAPTTLSRQRVVETPLALTAASANGLQGRPVSGAAPGAGQVLTWNGNAWTPMFVEGQSGMVGPQGPAGAIGKAGPGGPPGAVGPKGETGAFGRLAPLAPQGRQVELGQWARRAKPVRKGRRVKPVRKGRKVHKALPVH